MNACAPHEGVFSRQVCKRYRASSVLGSVTFAAPAGEVTLLAGRNGAGKTTWLRVALGMARPDRGVVLYGSDGIDTVRSRAAVVPDEPSVYGRFNGHANLRLLSGVRRPDRERLREIREMLGLDDVFLRLRARRYSLGQRRRLAIAAALLREPRYVFLDEPTIGLDPVAWEAVRAALRDLAGRGATVILTGQDFAEMERVSDRIAILHDGSIVFEGSAEALLRRRPPRVRVVLEDAAQLAARLRRPATLRNASTVDVACADDDDAAAVIGQVRADGATFRSLSIERDSLGEAFLAIHSEGAGAGDAEQA